MKLEGLVYCFNKLYCLFESFKSLNLSLQYIDRLFSLSYLGDMTSPNRRYIPLYRSSWIKGYMFDEQIK